MTFTPDLNERVLIGVIEGAVSLSGDAGNVIEEDRISAFSKTDARIAWVSPEQRYNVEIFVENLENEDQIFLNPVFFGQAGAISALTYRPGRNIGASVGVSF